MTLAERIFQAVQPMPDSMAKEVLHFVEYLRLKQEGRAWAALQEPGMQAVWDNEDDEIWNDVGRR